MPGSEPIVIPPLDPGAIQVAAAPPKTADAEAPAVTSIPYKILKQTSPEYDGAYWRRLNAFYEGGKCLLSDSALMSQVFPKHREEIEAVYTERKSRASYVPYAAEIVDHINAALHAQPVTMHVADEKGEDMPVPPFYEEFFEDVSPKGGRTVSLGRLLRDQVLRALICRTAWTRVDLPKRAEYASRADQEKAGALDAYCVAVDPMAVIDWEEDESGELIWAVIHTETRKRSGVSSSRGMITKRWVNYTRTDWQVYEIQHAEDKPPQDNDLIPMVDEDEHTFGRVPLLRLQVPDGLWAMNKLESLQRQHFNTFNLLRWAEFQSGAAELYEFHGPNMGTSGAPIGDKQEDPDRGTNQRRGQGYVQIRGHEDRAEFIGPDTSAFAHLLQACNNLRDEMHRVTHQMALSTDNGAAALGRSGESKAQDKAATSVILTALGQLVREHAEALLNLVSCVRHETQLEGKWSAKGMEKFDAVSVDDLVKQATDMETVSLPSPTFQRLFKLQVAKTILGDEATPDDIDTIEGELEENITAEQYDPANMIAPLVAGGDPNATGDEDRDMPPAPAKKKPAAAAKPKGGTMFDSGARR